MLLEIGFLFLNIRKTIFKFAFYFITLEVHYG